MNTEFIVLTVLSVFLLFAWLPGSVGKFRALGGWAWAFSNRDRFLENALPAWADRSHRAYKNLLAFYPCFAIVIMMLEVHHRFNEYTPYLTMVYLFSRALHFISYCFGWVLPRVFFWFISVIVNVGLFCILVNFS